ncbi:O-antigen ligase [Thioalkalivibrio sp. ALE17]|uniref:O-antigen ligase family protein n=1 Tax=Thioalkalivibrio sp. ALE17 TaxID=1158173 RepID=UPI00048EE056|nr:O-antigen ligase family protein [Thioalkalivibrio sp. ALE17]
MIFLGKESRHGSAGGAQERWSFSLMLVLALAGLALFVLPFGTGVFFPLAALSLAGLVLLAVGLPGLWAERWIRWALLLLLALWVPQLLSLIVAVDFDRALRTALTYPLFAIAILPLLWFARRRDVGTPLLYVVLALAVFWSLDGIFQFVTGANVLGYPYNGRRIDGLFHPNMRLGIVLAHFLPFVLEASRRLTYTNRLAALLPLIVIVAILLSGSRAAMVATLIVLFVYGLFLVGYYQLRMRTVSAFLSILVLGIVVALWASPETRDRLAVVSKASELSIEAIDEATARRGTIWLASWRVAMDEPILGVGVRGVEPVAEARGYTDMAFAHIHLYFLDVLVSTGIVGLVAYMGMLLAILLALWRRARRSERDLLPLYVVGGVAIFVALNPVNVHWTIYSSYTTAVLWLVVALALAPLVRGEAAARQGRPAGQRPASAS